MLDEPQSEHTTPNLQNYRIADLVKASDASVRLQNAIAHAAQCGTLPFNTVADYIAAGAAAQLLASTHIENLGRKSAAELDALIRMTVVPERTHEKVTPLPDIGTIIEQIYKRIGNLSTIDAISRHDIPVRLKNALEEADLLSCPFVENVIHFEKRAADLLRRPNFGKTSLTIWRGIIRHDLYRQIEQLGVEAEYAHAVVAYLFDFARSGRTALEFLCAQPIPECLTEEFLANGEPDDSIATAPLPDVIGAALATLTDRQQDVLRRRFGIGINRHTLEEVGQIYGVTRERIRQLEATALRKLRFRFGKRIRAACLGDFASTWEAYARDDAVTEKELDARRHAISPENALAFDVTNLSLKDCLSDFGRKCEGGWTTKDFPIDLLREAEGDLKDRACKYPLPCPWPLLLPSATNQIASTAIRFSLYLTYMGYVVNERPRERIRRAIRAHALLTDRGRPADVLALLKQYRETYADDQCSGRDLDIVISAHPHLFVAVSDRTWAALGSRPDALNVDDGPSLGDRPEFADDDLDNAGEASSSGQAPLTNARALENALRRCGPLRLSEILERGEEFMPPGRSLSSIGPTLLLNKELFERPLPGLYALPGQIPVKPSIQNNPPNYLLSENQVRVYSFARWCGEPWGTFSLWCPELEVAWCRWARERCAPETLNALLAVVKIDDWNVPLVEAERWRALASTRADFGLQFSPRDGALVLPDLNSVLAACLVVRDRRSLGWIGANRIMQRRLTDHTSAGLLAVLIALGVLKCPEHWQMKHDEGDNIEAATALLTEHRQRNTHLTWDSELGQSLRRQIALYEGSETSREWLSPNQLTEADAEDTAPAVSVEAFIEDLKLQEQEDSFEILLKSIVGNPPL